MAVGLVQAQPVVSVSPIIEVLAEETVEYIPISTTTPLTNVASWYDYELKDEPNYSKENATCASRDYERGILLQITNTDNGSAVVCRVNDWVENPDVVIDLSSYAFKKLALLELGILTDIRISNIACSCIKTARYFGQGIPFGVNAEDLKSNTTPGVGKLALFSYKEYEHAGIITAIDDKGFWVKEGNFKKCEITERYIYWNDSSLRGFHIV